MHDELHSIGGDFINKTTQGRSEPCTTGDLQSPHSGHDASSGHEELSETSEQPSLDMFMDTFSRDAATKLAVGGPIVILNVSRLRGDAILITSEGIRCLHLPRLDGLLPQELQRKAEYFIQNTEHASEEQFTKHSAVVEGILEWLWDDVVEPVLDELGFTTTPGEGETWPRIWWITTGVLSVLPIHAAGYHTECPPRAAVDRVVSSYVPTLRALADARSRFEKASTPHEPTMAILGMPETPGMRDLEAELEIGIVMSFMAQCSNTVVTTTPRKADVLTALEDHEYIHIACHGEASIDDPSLSRLFLTDWEQDPLTVNDIAKIQARSGQFAYLAACHTSSVREFNLMDESISLASSVLSAGFPSVIGTLWSIPDEDSAKVAREFYRHMVEGKEHQGSQPRFDTERSALALHSTVRAVRNALFGKGKGIETDTEPWFWAAFVHIGI